MLNESLERNCRGIHAFRTERQIECSLYAQGSGFAAVAHFNR